MEEWDPWSAENAKLVETLLRAAMLSGMIEDEGYNFYDLPSFVENGEKLGLLGDMSREMAILTLGLWMGRYQGNQDSGIWKVKDFKGADSVEILKNCCQEFLDIADSSSDSEFWSAVARLQVSVYDLHPENEA